MISIAISLLFPLTTMPRFISEQAAASMMNLLVSLVPFLVTVALINRADSLYCFHCTNITEGLDCNGVTDCQEGESCYIEKTVHSNGSLYTLGCMKKSQCPDDHVSSLVGRAVNTHCKHCCEKDGCNKQYCEAQSTTVHGGWSGWTPWESCSVSSGTGLRRRHRNCTNPEPSAHGRYCVGDPVEYVLCQDTGYGNNTIIDYSVRLVNGPNSNSGRVEIYYGGSWGTICDMYWDDKDARVVCRMLGFSNGIAKDGTSFGPGPGNITVEEMHCIGNESMIAYCPHSHWFYYYHGCNHYNDAGVICS